ncbi:hypothetical protein PM082_018544 [Marasmius tenuissimus]|nr:hypothetical protein PM082_018544 [Marasmius tenuissimus]
MESDPEDAFEPNSGDESGQSESDLRDTSEYDSEDTPEQEQPRIPLKDEGTMKRWVKHSGFSRNAHISPS